LRKPPKIDPIIHNDPYSQLAIFLLSIEAKILPSAVIDIGYRMGKSKDYYFLRDICV
jgi:hypothetical protein